MKSLYAGTPKNPAAMCKYHRCYLTVKEMKRHECLRKECACLVKYEHPYWEQREVMKEKKKEKRAALEARLGR